MTQDPAAAPVPVAFSANGSATPSMRTAEASERNAEASERAAALLAQLPQAIGMMLGQVVRAMPSQPVCATCLVNRIAWETTHRAETESAITRGREAHGIPEGAPLPPGFDPVPFLPPQLQPGGSQGIPPLTGAITIANGAATCSEHVPGRPTGRAPLLVAQGALSPSVMASLRA